MRRDDGYRTVCAVTVDRSAEAILASCQDLEHLSTVFDCPVELREDEGGRRLVTTDDTGAAGWAVEIHAESGTGPFHWRVEAGPLAHEGELELVTAPGGRGTELRVRLRYRDSRVGHQAAVLRGRDLDQSLRTVLRRAKSVLEAGEVVSTMAEPAGRSGIAERATRVVRGKLSAGGRP